MKILFIGNSATYKNDVPQTLALLATEAGYPVAADMIVKGGYKLCQHVENEDVFQAIKSGYDIVVLQDNLSCVSTDEMRQKCKSACGDFASAIRQAGAKPYVYVRPPYGYEKYGYEPLEQCEQVDQLFNEISETEGTTNIYVNRAFAEAIRTTQIPLWGPDNAHTSKLGGYLVVCTMFASIFKTSATILKYTDISPDEAKALQAIADKVTLG